MTARVGGLPASRHAGPPVTPQPIQRPASQQPGPSAALCCQHPTECLNTRDCEPTTPQLSSYHSSALHCQACLDGPHVAQRNMPLQLWTKGFSSSCFDLAGKLSQSRTRNILAEKEGQESASVYLTLLLVPLACSCNRNSKRRRSGQRHGCAAIALQVGRRRLLEPALKGGPRQHASGGMEAR